MHLCKDNSENHSSWSCGFKARRSSDQKLQNSHYSLNKCSRLYMNFNFIAYQIEFKPIILHFSGFFWGCFSVVLRLFLECFGHIVKCVFERMFSKISSILSLILAEFLSFLSFETIFSSSRYPAVKKCDFFLVVKLDFLRLSIDQSVFLLKCFLLKCAPNWNSYTVPNICFMNNSQPCSRPT